MRELNHFPWGDMFLFPLWLFFIFLAIGIIIVVIVLVLLIVKVIKVDRVDQRIFAIPQNADPDKVFNDIILAINRLGYIGFRQGDKYILHATAGVKVTVELLRGPNPMILCYASIESWLIALLLVFVLLSLMWLAGIIALILYLKYDSVKETIHTAITSTLSRST